MTFYQYWQKLLQGTCQAPDLNPQVRPTPPPSSAEAQRSEGVLSHYSSKAATAAALAGRPCLSGGVCFEAFNLLAITCLLHLPCPQVYEMSEAAASQHWQHKLLYTQAGGIATTGTDGLLAIRQVSTWVSEACYGSWLCTGALTVDCCLHMCTFRGSAAMWVSLLVL
jgi:hypothetical protein